MPTEALVAVSKISTDAIAEPPLHRAATSGWCARAIHPWCLHESGVVHCGAVQCDDDWAGGDLISRATEIARGLPAEAVVTSG